MDTNYYIHKGEVICGSYMWLRTVRAVLWSFLGIRKASEYQKDIDELNPVIIIVVGVVTAIVFVLALVLLVNCIV